MKLTKGDTIAMQKISKENLELRETVKRQTVELENKNRELEIENSLERVRTVAMGMKRPDDLLNICEVLFNELRALGFTELRNALIHTFVDEENYFNDYDYSDLTGGTVSRTPYKGHPVIEEFIRNIRKANDAFSENIVTGKELEDWKEFRRINGQADDPRLDNISALYYYNYSVGPAGIGISTFSSIPDNKREVLKRFRNVFDFAYKRYTDVAQAEAQAREAEIELALERVRARTMAMQKSEELSETSSVLFHELKNLGIETIRSGVGIFNGEDDTAELWLTTESDKKIETRVIGSVPAFAHPAFQKWFTDWKRKEPFFSFELTGDSVRNYYETLSTYLSLPPQQVYHSKECLNGFFFPEGSLNVITQELLGEESSNIMLRFARVFGLLYRRFLDLQKAEAQAWEAKIEVALERVRSKAMAMHKSDDLNMAVATVFEELDKLNLGMTRCGIGILNKEKRSGDVWITAKSGGGNTIQVSGDESMDIHPLLKGAFDAWLKQGDFSYVLEGEDLSNYYQALSKTNFQLPESVSLDTGKKDQKQYYYVTPFEAGTLFAFRETIFPEEAKLVMKRFAGVFNLTYKRFLDIQKAEAQAREAQIETGLERVRSRTLAMHKSDELAETAAVVFKQLINLDIEPSRLYSLYIGIFKDESGEIESWPTDEKGSKPNQKFILNIHRDVSVKKIYEAWRERKRSIIIDIQGKELDNYLHYLHDELGIPLTQGMSQKRRIQYIAYFDKGFIGIASPDEQPKETLQLLERFAAVFNLTYTRFNDLQIAEAQTHKANIEVALERVRARALAMQQPEELKEVAEVLRYEMGLLGVEELETCSIYINDESAEKAECWYALKDLRVSEKKLVNDHFALDLNDTWVGRKMLKFYNSAEKQTSIMMKGANRKEWINYCEEKSVPFRGYYGEIIPDRTYHLYKFSHGAIGAAAAGDISAESWDLLQRAASVFSLAYSRFKDLTKARVDLQQLKEEKKRSDSLLLNILPADIAAELKQFGKSYARKHEQVSILFTDIKGFSTISETLSAEELVNQLDECFRAFDHIVGKHGLEKIKTIGDAYICACGLPNPDPDNAVKAIRAALDMLDFAKGFGMTKIIQDLPAFEFRVGIHTGPVITGVVGLKKFTYDIWGDAVNMAARMEQHGEAGKINVSGNTYELIKDKFTCTHRGKILAKNKGEVDMYFVEKANN